LKKIAVFLIIVLAAVIIAAAGLIYFSVKMNEAPAGMPVQTVFRVNRGDTADVIAENLYEQQLIRSSIFFEFYVRLRQTGGSMKSGLYRIDQGASAIQIHDILLRGAEELYKVAVPPGLTSTEIAGIMQNNGITGKDAFIAAVKEQNAEGMLFPDTYSFPKDYPADKTVEYMVDTFKDSISTVFPDFNELSEDEVKQKIIMASIIEREYRQADEAPRIASVFYNRIEQNMYLGSCATVVYVITEELGREHPDKLLYRDLEIKSPFNTYINKGLPPGPICNPGLVALNAAFNPENTDYLYFLLEDPETGKHFFSKNLAEHNRSYELYIKGK